MTSEVAYKEARRSGSSAVLVQQSKVWISRQNIAILHRLSLVPSPVEEAARNNAHSEQFLFDVRNVPIRHQDNLAKIESFAKTKSRPLNGKEFGQQHNLVILQRSRYLHYQRLQKSSISCTNHELKMFFIDT